MIDLDALEDSTSSSELYCRFGSLLVLGRLNYCDWNTVVRRLGIHQYVLPDRRVLNEALLDTIYGRFKKSSTFLMWYALLLGHIESHYNETQQQRILTILLQSYETRWAYHSRAPLPHGIITETPL